MMIVDVLAGVLAITALYKIQNWSKMGRPTPVTSSQKRSKRFQIQKEILSLEIFINESDLEIKQMDNSFSKACKEGLVNNAEKLEEKLLKRQEAKLQLKRDTRRLLDAENDVIREEMLETI